MEKFTVTLKTITPLFLGGAEPDKCVEFRAPSIKGAMRFWYRTIDAEYVNYEGKIFGSLEDGQGVFSIKLLTNARRANGFIKSNYDLLSVGTGRHTKNGVIYLGFSLETGNQRFGNYRQRKYIDAEENIRFEIIFKKNPDVKVKRVILSSIWLLGHIGGLGSRSRRGFGTVALQSWNSNWDECADLPIAHQAKSTDQWMNDFKKGLHTLKKWFKEFTIHDHSIFDKNTMFYMFNTGQNAKTISKDIKGKNESRHFQAWEMALHDAGMSMQSFRQRYDLADKKSDYYKVKEHLAFIDNTGKASGKWGITANKISEAPKRVVFGLPLTFQSSYQDGLKSNGKPNYCSVSTSFIGEKHERNASPIFIRIVKINSICHPFYIRLDFPFLEENEKVKDGVDSYKMQDTSILDDFWKYMKSKNNGIEVSWK
ncbi:MAG: hypothetical protein HCAMLNBO_01357 [Candidatus Brocadia fulgida]|nr:hypothetical protein [Candidatus Brocadia fulgida]